MQTRKNFSFDIIGTVVIIELPALSLRKKAPKEIEKETVKYIRKTHPNVKTILKKQSNRKGEFRLRALKKIFGTETKTTHKEYGMQFRLDVAKAYFSPRESTERQRIAGQVKPKENVLVMFAGIGPYAIAIAKKQPKVGKIYAIEINPVAVKYMEENIRINNVGDKIIPISGDAKKKAKQFYDKCDRIVMPLPLEAHKFLSIALKCLKKKGTIHFYSIGKGNDLFSEPEKIIKKECKKEKVKYKIISRKKTLPYGPRRFKVCIEFSVRHQ